NELLLDVCALDLERERDRGGLRLVEFEERLRHLACGSVRLKRHLPRVPILRGQESAHEDDEQRDVDGVCAQTIPRAALGEDERLAVLLRHSRLELEAFARGADA